MRAQVREERELNVRPCLVVRGAGRAVDASETIVEERMWNLRGHSADFLVEVRVNANPTPIRLQTRNAAAGIEESARSGRILHVDRAVFREALDGERIGERGAGRLDAPAAFDPDTFRPCLRPSMLGEQEKNESERGSDDHRVN